MATSISRVQAEALAEGFLDNIGSTDRGLKPLQVYSEAILIAYELAEEMQENMIESKIIASGKGAESIEVAEPEEAGGVIRIDVFMNFYLKFQNKGVRGTKSGNGLYQFKNEYPSKKMVQAISEWIRRAQKSYRTIKGNDRYKTYGRHEHKVKRVSEISNAYAKARNIKMYGIKPTGFLDKAADSAEKKFADRLGDALVIDVIDAIRNK